MFMLVFSINIDALIIIDALFEKGASMDLRHL